MARLPRLTVPDGLHLVLQRGNNQQAIAASAADHDTLLALVMAHAAQHRVAVHAYVLLPNRFQLLVTPRGSDGLSPMMQAVGRRYVRYFNDAHGRSGTLWDGRYRSTVLQAERHLLPCMAWFDLAPVREGLTQDAAGYRWSSHGHYAGLRGEKGVTPHPLLWTLGNTPFAREAAYAELVRAGVDAAEQAALEQAARSGWALGDADFVLDLQKRTERRVSPKPAGRPSAAARER